MRLVEGYAPTESDASLADKGKDCVRNTRVSRTRRLHRDKRIGPYYPRGTSIDMRRPMLHKKHDNDGRRAQVPFVVRAALLAVLAVSSAVAQEERDVSVRPLEAGTIDLHATDTRLVDILQELADATNRNIVIGNSVDGTRITVSLSNMTIGELLDAILPSAGCTYRDHGKFIVVDTIEHMRSQKEGSSPPVIKVFKLGYTNAKTVAKMITPFLGESARIVASPEAETGIDSGTGETGGDSVAAADVVVIEAPPERLREIARVIAELDAPPAQVLVEATIVRAALTDDTQLGIDFSFLSGVDFERVGSTSTGGVDLSAGMIPPSEFDDGIAAVRTDFQIPFNQGGFTFGLIKNNVAVFVRALEQLTDISVVANPKILTLNKQRGEVIVGRRDGYITTTVTQTAAVQTVSFLETGTQLTFRPFILNDQQVRMEIHVEDSAGGLTPSDLPFESTTETTTNILVRDGRTVLIGGLFRTSDEMTRSQTPGIGEIPILGALARRTEDKSTREEVMVLLTVHIITNPELHEELGQSMLEEANRMRLGIRDRVQWFGRRRLAEIHVASAVRQLDAGHRNRALFHARMALSADPLISVGRRLREQLLHDRDTIGPELDLRDWVARLLNEKPSIDSITGQPISIPNAYRTRTQPPPRRRSSDDQTDSNTVPVHHSKARLGSSKPNANQKRKQEQKQKP
jgi:type IV pilus assembly protein PilQ